MRLKTILTIALILVVCSTAQAFKKGVFDKSTMGEKIRGGGIFGHFHISDPKDKFTSACEEILWFGRFHGYMAAYKAALTAHWITPAGETYKTQPFSTRDEDVNSAWAKLDLKGVDKAALDLEGEWRIKVYWDEVLIDERTFHVGERKFLQADPAETAGTIEGYLILAEAYSKKNDATKAIVQIQRAQEIDPDSPLPYIALGQTYNSINKPDDAILQFTKAEALGGDKIAIHRGLGVAYMKLNLLEQSIKEYEAVLKLSPNSPGDLENIDNLKKALELQGSGSLTQMPGDPASPTPDTYVETSIDKSKVSVGEPVMLKYFLFISKSSSYNGFQTELEVPGYLINMIKPKEKWVAKPSGDSIFSGSVFGSRKISSATKDAVHDGTHEEASYFGIGLVWDNSQKVLNISSVDKNGASADILLPNDRVSAINGQVITDGEQTAHILSSQDVTKESIFTVLRGDMILNLPVVPLKSHSDSSVLNQSEIALFPFDAEYIQNVGLRVLSVDEPGPLLVGDIIGRIDETLIRSVGDWRKVTNGLKAGQEYKFIIHRQGAEHTISLPAKNSKIMITAEYALKSQKNLNRTDVKADGKKYSKVAIETVTLRFDAPGSYVINPGSLDVTIHDGVESDKVVLPTTPIELTVFSPKAAQPPLQSAH